MIFTLYKHAKKFADDVTNILKRQEIQNNLLFKNINSGLACDDNSNMIMATIKEDNGRIVLTAVQTLPFPMVMFETDNIRNDTAVNFFADSLIKNNIAVDFILTEKKLAKSFCEFYGNRMHKTFENNESLVLYVLDKVNPLTLPSGSFRTATNADLFYLPYWFADFVVACHLGEYNLENSVQDAQNAVNTGELYIWEDGIPLSLAANVRQTSDCAFIGRVYTPPHLRGKGYCTACVSFLSQKLLNNGYKCCALYADCANPFSNKVYRKIGYKPVFWMDQYKSAK